MASSPLMTFKSFSNGFLGTLMSEGMSMLTNWPNKELERNNLTNLAAMTQPDKYSGTISRRSGILVGQLANRDYPVE